MVHGLAASTATISTESAPWSNNFRALVRPNPADETATIDYTTTVAGAVQVTLADPRGGVIYSARPEPKTPGNHRISLNLSYLPSGLYVYRIVSPEGSISGTIGIRHRR